MNHWFGFRGLWWVPSGISQLKISKAHLGIADNAVAPGKRGERKSVGVERTFRDKTDDEEIMATLEEIAVELGKDLEKLQYAGKTVTVKYKVRPEARLHLSWKLTISCTLMRVRLAEHIDRLTVDKTRAHSVKRFISTKEEILPVSFGFILQSQSSPMFTQIAQELLRRELPLRIRLLGIRLSTLKDLTVPDKGIRNVSLSPLSDADASSFRPGQRLSICVIRARRRRST
jgi:DNA polymerase kappa